MEQKVKTNGLRWLFCLALMLGLMIGLAGPAMAKNYREVDDWNALNSAINNYDIPIKLSDNWEEPKVHNDPLTINSG